MSILRALGLGGGGGAERAGAGPSGGDTDTVRRIVAALEELPPERARYLAAFAYILGRVAHADREISEEETAAMERIVARLGRVPEEQAVLIVQMAKSQNRLFGGTENFLVTREFVEISTPEQRQELLDCLFEVSAADDSISAPEEHQIGRIASELGLTHADLVEARRAYARHREVLKPLLG